MIGVGYCPATHTDVIDVWVNKYSTVVNPDSVKISKIVGFGESILGICVTVINSHQTERDHLVGCINSKCGISDDPICEKIPHCGIYKPRCEYK